LKDFDKKVKIKYKRFNELSFADLSMEGIRSVEKMLSINKNWLNPFGDFFAGKK